MIDLELTRERFSSTGRTAAGWARANGFDPERIRNVLRGRFKPCDAEIEAMERDGLLVKKAA